MLHACQCKQCVKTPPAHEALVENLCQLENLYLHFSLGAKPIPSPDLKSMAQVFYDNQGTCSAGIPSLFRARLHVHIDSFQRSPNSPTSDILCCFVIQIFIYIYIYIYISDGHESTSHRIETSAQILLFLYRQVRTDCRSVYRQTTGTGATQTFSVLHVDLFQVIAAIKMLKTKVQSTVDLLYIYRERERSRRCSKREIFPPAIHPN